MEKRYIEVSYSERWLDEGEFVGSAILDRQTGFLFDISRKMDKELDETDEIESISIFIGSGKDMTVVAYDIPFEGSSLEDYMSHTVGRDDLKDIDTWVKAFPDQFTEKIPQAIDPGEDRQKLLKQKVKDLNIPMNYAGQFAGIIGEDDDILEKNMLLDAIGNTRNSDLGKAVFYHKDSNIYQVENNKQRDARQESIKDVKIESTLPSEGSVEEPNTTKPQRG